MFLKLFVVIFLCFPPPAWCHSPVGTEEEVGGNRQRHNRHARDPAPGSLERRIDELEKVRA